MPQSATPPEERSESLLTVLIALGANTVIAVLKTVVAAITGSASMVAEATHSWADTGNEVFLYLAEKRSSRHADRDHPLGFGRAAYVWSMMAAFGLFAVGAAVSLLHGIQSLGEAEAEVDYFWAYVVLAGSFVLESISFIQAQRQLRSSAARAEMPRLGYLSATSNPTLRAVFFEDASALIGILLAGGGIVAHQLTGDPVYDAIGSILVGLLLGVVAIYLLSRNMAFLVGQVADERIIGTVRSWLLEQPEVAEVTYLHLEFVGPERLLCIASVDLAGDDAESEAESELAALETRLEAQPIVQKAIITLGSSAR